MKRCATCDSAGPFYVNAQAPDGLHRNCKECCKARMKRYYRDHRDLHKSRVVSWRQRNLEQVARVTKTRYVRAQYNLSLEVYETLRAAATTCAICRVVFSDDAPANLDHDHSTGAIREFLCRDCNFMLGHGRDNPEIISAGAAYLRRHRAA